LKGLKMPLKRVVWPQRDAVIEFVRANLQNGPKNAHELYTEGRETYGWGKTAVYRAAVELKVTSVRVGRDHVWQLEDFDGSVSK